MINTAKAIYVAFCHSGCVPDFPSYIPSVHNSNKGLAVFHVELMANKLSPNEVYGFVRKFLHFSSTEG